MRPFPLAAVASLLMLSPAAHAVDFDFDIQPGATQADFKDIAEDVSAILNAKSLTPAEPYGITGFGIGVFGTYVETQNPDAWQNVIGEEVDEIGLVGLTVQKGLPLGVDVGASYSWIPQAEANLLGLELRYALLEGGVATPAIGLRGSYSKLSGFDDLDYDSYGLDLSVSKGFGPLTPYAGIGHVWSKFKVDQFGLDDENVDDMRYFVGLRLSALFGITPEYERIGDHDVFNLRIGFAF